MFHWRLHSDRNRSFIASRLRYASKTSRQYQAAVKLLGSFRLAAGNRHLYRYCIFTGLLGETVSWKLRLSCRSELTRQGTSLPLDRYSSYTPYVTIRYGPYLHPAVVFAKRKLQRELGVWPLRGHLIRVLLSLSHSLKIQISNIRHEQLDFPADYPPNFLMGFQHIAEFIFQHYCWKAAISYGRH